MILLLAPSKGQKIGDHKSATTTPLFHQEACELNNILLQKSNSEIAALMKTSAKLTEQTIETIHSFSSNPQAGAAAIHTYSGDTYSSLSPEKWQQKQGEYAQDHLLILSGLYGALRPYDRIQPYRLEMGLRLPNQAGKNMYAYWTKKLTDLCNNLIAKHDSKFLVNLASTEYSKVLDAKNLNAEFIEIIFRQRRGDNEKSIAIHSKRARGLMAEYSVQGQINSPLQLKNFNEDGYCFDTEKSDDNRFIFYKNLSN